MTPPFKTIGIIGRVRNPGVKETLKTLIEYLQQLKQDIRVETETAATLQDPSLHAVSREMLSKQCQLIIVVGGDGSLLNAALAVVESEVPVLGINRGSLGFLTDIHPAELSKIKDILDGHYTLEKRFLLTATIESRGKQIGQGDALNEVALIPDAVPHMLEFEIYIDEQFLCSQHADGLIVATPTGSTAYALSGGGPILHPELDAIVIVPMFPHTLSIRPIVIAGNHRITIALTSQNITAPRLTCDGQAYLSLPQESRIHIDKKPKQLHLIHPLDYDYYAALRSKLHWGRLPC